jgi:Protein of unknown function (DUF1232)
VEVALQDRGHSVLHRDVIDAEESPTAPPDDFLGSLFRMLTDPQAAWFAKGLALAALLYVISPIDLVPDFVPFLGLADDLVAVFAAAASMIAATRRYASEHPRSPGSGTDAE